MVHSLRGIIITTGESSILHGIQQQLIWKAGLVVHLGHGGDPCPNGRMDGEDIAGDVEDEWEDIQDQPRPHHLSGGTDRSCLTVVHTSGVHFCNVRYCNCPNAGASHLQLVKAGLFLATTKEPRTSVLKSGPVWFFCLFWHEPDQDRSFRFKKIVGPQLQLLMTGCRRLRGQS